MKGIDAQICTEHSRSSESNLGKSGAKIYGNLRQKNTVRSLLRRPPPPPPSDPEYGTGYTQQATR